MINNCRDLHLLSAIVILFLISNSELSLANMNGFPLKMVFIAVEDTNIVILLTLLLQLLMLTSQSLLLILKSKFWVLTVMYPLDRACTDNLPLATNISDSAVLPF